MENFDFSHNGLTTLDEQSIRDLRVTALIKVDFSHNNIDYIELQTFKGEPRLEQLDLSWNKLRYFNRRTLTFTHNIERLSLAGNQQIVLIQSGYFLGSTSLQHLNMSSCELGFIPDNTFGKLPNLRSLDLSHNRLTKLRPEALSGLSHLERLDLSYNHLDSQQLDTLSQRLTDNVTIVTAAQCPNYCLCPSPTVANCSGVNAAQLPKSSLDARMENFDFSHNRLTRLDEQSIRDLRVTALIKVDFSHNNIDYIEPQTFKGEPRLEQLDLSWNKLRYFNRRTLTFTHNIERLSLAGNHQIVLIQSGSFLESTSLQHLNMSSCELGFIPDNTFGELPNLRSLDLSHNRLTKLRPEALSGLSHLERLDLSYNHLDSQQLDTLSQRLSRYVTIVTGPQRVSPCSWPKDALANCSHKGLTALPAVRFSSFIRDVDLSHNHLTRLTKDDVATLRGIGDLYSLDFSHNLIDSIDEDALEDCLWMKEVDLSWNRLFSINPITFLHNSYIERLSLAGNTRLILDSYGNFLQAWPLKHLNLSNTYLTNIPNNSFAGVYNLQTLDVSHNSLVYLHPNAFFGLKKLEKLDLSHNILENITAEVLSGLSQLKVLDLSYNKLTTLNKDVVYSFPKLYLLDVRYNMLETLEVDVLERLLLGRTNRIKREVGASTQLEVVGNPWNCDCRMKPALDWCTMKGVTLQITCQIPDNLSHKPWNEISSKICDQNPPTAHASSISALGVFSSLLWVMAIRTINALMDLL